MKNFIIFFDNRMNPIVVKELRQGLQSWFIIVIVNLMLVALTMTCVLLVMSNPEITEEATGGRKMFFALQAVLFAASIVCVPMYVLHRLQTERDGSSVDLFFSTTLKPHKIVRGKFVAGMSLITLLYSVCLPFILFSYFLQGYDIPTMLFSLAMGYLATIPILMAAIVIGSWTVPHVFTLFIKVGALWGLILVVVGLSVLSDEEMLRHGIQYYLRHGEFLWVCGTILMAGLLISKLLETMAIGLLAPPSSNRTLPLRIWMTISIFIVAAFLAGLGIYIQQKVAVHIRTDWLEVFLFMAFAWMIVTLALVTIMLIIAICEPDKFSNRIMLQRPRTLVFRLVAFPFTHGASSGILWCAIHTALAFGVFGTAYYFVTNSSSPLSRHALDEVGEVIPWVLVFFSCLVAYALLAKLVMRAFFRRVPARYTWATFLFVFMALVISSMVICFIVDTRHWDQLLFWKIFNPMSEFSYHYAHYETQLKTRIYIDIIWALAMLIICTPKGIRDFMRYAFEKPAPTLDEGKIVAAKKVEVTLAAEGVDS